MTVIKSWTKDILNFLCKVYIWDIENNYDYAIKVILHGNNRENINQQIEMVFFFVLYWNVMLHRTK